MSIQKEIWLSDLSKVLYAKSPWLNICRNMDVYSSNRVVRIPQSTAIGASNITKNKSVLPLTVGTNVQTELTFNLDSFANQPILVEDIDTVQLAFDKRADILEQMSSVVSERIGQESLINWSVPSSATTGCASKIVKTNGEAFAGGAEDAEGNRSGITLSNLQTANAVLDKENVSRENRWCIMSSDMYNNFLTTPDGLKTLNADYIKANLAKGAVNMIHGFNIMVTPTTPVYSSAFVKAAYGAATSSDNNQSAICFGSKFVAKANHGNKVFYNENDAAYLGSYMSSEILFGSSRCYTNYIGIVNIVEQA